MPSSGSRTRSCRTGRDQPAAPSSARVRVSCLLDTNACIAIISGRPQSVRRRLRSALVRGEPVAVSLVALFELWYGVAKSARSAANTERLAIFLAPLETLPFRR